MFYGMNEEYKALGGGVNILNGRPPVLINPKKQM